MKKKFLTAAIILAVAVSVFSGCSNNKANTTEPTPEPTQQTTEQETTTKPVEETTIKTEIETQKPTELSKTEYLRSGYWCFYDGGASMTAYTFESDDAGYGKFYGHCHIYDVKNNKVTERTEENTHEHNTNAIINYEITDNAVLLTEEGGLVSELKFTDDKNVLIRNNGGKEQRYYHFDSVPNYNELQSIASSKTNNDQPSETKEDTLTDGMWVKYSPQAAVFDTYVFSDGIIEHKTYSFDNGTVKEYNYDGAYSFMTYTVNNDGVTIKDDKSREWTYYFTDDEDIMERTYQDTVGTDTFTATEKLYHHDSLPSYETAKEESKKKG